MQSFPPYNQIDHPAMPKSKLNSLLIILIVTLFASGGALIFLKQIDAYHRQQIYIAEQAALPVHKTSAAQTYKIKPITPTEEILSPFKIYQNTKYGFEFTVPSDSKVVDDRYVYKEGDETKPGVGVQVIEFASLPKTIIEAEKIDCPINDPHCMLRSVTQEEYLKIKEAIVNKNTKYLKAYYLPYPCDKDLNLTFISGGVLKTVKSCQASGYVASFEIFDKNNNLITIFDFMVSEKAFSRSNKSQIIEKIGETFKFISVPSDTGQAK